MNADCIHIGDACYKAGDRIEYRNEYGQQFTGRIVHVSPASRDILACFLVQRDDKTTPEAINPTKYPFLRHLKG